MLPSRTSCKNLTAASDSRNAKPFWYSDHDDDNADDIALPATTSSVTSALCSGLKQFLRMPNNSNEIFSLKKLIEKLNLQTTSKLLQDFFLENND